MKMLILRRLALAWVLVLLAWPVATPWAAENTAVLATTPNEDFKFYPQDIDYPNDGTAYHKKTGLTWKRCIEGWSWNGSTCVDDTGVTDYYTWSAALQLGPASNFASFTDWRLPNLKELQSIVEKRNYNPAINTTVFPNTLTTPGYYFWSASPFAPAAGFAWGVDFSNGVDLADYEGSGLAVRLVRGGQYSLLSVTKAGGGSGAVTSSQPGIDCGNFCQGSFANELFERNQVVLTATPNPTSTFGGWTNCPSVSGNQCTVNSANNLTVTATFKGNTTTTISNNTPDPSVVGETVTVNYAVAVTAPGTGTPTGNVTVSDGTVSCTGTVAAGTCNLTFTSAGARTLTATYSGDPNFNGSTSAGGSHTVNQANTTTTISSDDPDPSAVGETVTVNFSVAAAASAPTAARATVQAVSGGPTGSVTVTADSGETCLGTLNAGAGSCPLTFLSAGPKTLTATYSGDPNFNGSTSADVPHQVDQAATTTTIGSDTPDPSVVGQAVTVNYSVTAGAGTPSGTVTVSDGTVNCTGTLPATSCPLTFTSAGARTLTATYSGDPNFNGSTSAGVPHQVDQAATTTTISSDTPDPSVVGETVTVNYAVTVTTPGTGTPTGNVTVSDGTVSCIGTVAAGACNLAFPSAGPKTLTAVYAGDTNFNGSTSVGASHTVNKTNTTTAITSDDPDPSAVGETVTVNFSVAAASAPAAARATQAVIGGSTGGVTVTANSGETCSGTLSGGAGSCTLTFPSAGARTLTATYAGDDNFNGSTSASESHTVNQAATTTTISSDTPDPSVVGEAVTVNYAVAVTAPGTGTPTGNVTVSDGTVSCTGTVAAGTCNLTFPSAGAKTLTATYAGDANFNGSTSAGVPHQVDQATTTTTITSDDPDPSAVGETVTVSYTVAVTAPGTGTPTGTVTVSDGAGTTCTGTLPATSCTLTFPSAGARTLTAAYAGDDNFDSSTSVGVSHTVNKTNTTTLITSDDPEPSAVDQAVTVNFSVAAASAPAAARATQAVIGGPTGGVTVTANSGETCSGTLSGGAGSCTLTFPSAGARTLTATYAGDDNFDTSTSIGEPHTVLATTAQGDAGGGLVTADITGGTCIGYAAGSTQFIAAPTPLPPGITFPYGVFGFTVVCPPEGGTVTLFLTYPNPLPPGTQYWKYGPTPDDPASHWYVLPATIAGNTATITITDGGLGDDDLIADGDIEDQGGPGMPGAGVETRGIPTLSTWALLLFSALLGLLGFRRPRRHT